MPVDYFYCTLLKLKWGKCWCWKLEKTTFLFFKKLYPVITTCTTVPLQVHYCCVNLCTLHVPVNCKSGALVKIAMERLPLRRRFKLFGQIRRRAKSWVVDNVTPHATTVGHIVLVARGFLCILVLTGSSSLR